MLIVNHILGRHDEPRFSGRGCDRVHIASADAGRRRMRVQSEDGIDIGIDLPAHGWLFDGAVLHDDGERILVVARKPEPVMVVSLAGMPADTAFAAAFRIGHALGNKHSPVELHGHEIVAPVTDTPELAVRPVLTLGLSGLELRFEERPFAAAAPPVCAGAAHEHHHHDSHRHEAQG